MVYRGDDGTDKWPRLQKEVLQFESVVNVRHKEGGMDPVMGSSSIPGRTYMYL